MTELAGESELTATATHASAVSSVLTERTSEGLQITSSGSVETGNALSEVVAGRQCAVLSIEETFKFRKVALERKKTTITTTFTKRRQVVGQWSFQLTMKKQSADQSCALAQRTHVAVEK